MLLGYFQVIQEYIMSLKFDDVIDIALHIFFYPFNIKISAYFGYMIVLTAKH
jgi:hypothetical protein